MKKTCTYIGGQAVLEGVMMRGKSAYAMACRDDSGTIQVEAEKLPDAQKSAWNAFKRLPFVRGVFSLLSSMVLGTKITMRSAEVYAGTDEEEEPSGFEKWLAEKLHLDLTGVVMTISMFIGVIFSVGLFVFLPYLLTNLICEAAGIGEKTLGYNFMEGGFRILIFIVYIVLTSLMKDIRRTYMYHGAEHKTITCFEKGLPLTVENVKTCSRIHDRCGTTFLFFVMTISILVFSIANSFLPFTDMIESGILRFLVRFLIKLVLVPVVAGISYEILRLLAKVQSNWILPLKAPGLSLQLLTTREPTDDMIECAIVAFNRVLAMDEGKIAYESSFAVGGTLESVKERIDQLFDRAGIEGEESEWILSLNLNVPVSDLKGEMIISGADARKIYKVVNERLTGRPLWYVVGDTNFCGYTLKVDERVLIPRPETEVLVENAVKLIKDGDKVLDLCTGSGAIAIAVKKMAEAEGKKVIMTAVDISEDALALAKENAESNGAEVGFIHSDLFENVEGKFDVILSNPPYIERKTIEGLQREVKDFEPRLALDGGEDGLDFYRAIAGKVKEHFIGSFMLLEVGMGQANAVCALFEAQGYHTEVIKDLSGVERIVKVTE